MFDPVWRRMVLQSSVVLIALGVSSCGDARARAAVHVNELSSLAYAEELRIGSVDDPEIGFSRIRSIRVSETGNVYVLDGSAKEVRVFDAQGKRLRVIGGPGNGPGEFSIPYAMWLLGDTLWVADASARRLTWFGPDGKLLSSMQVQGVPFEGGVRGVRMTLSPNRPRPDGLIESELDMFIAGDREIRPYRYPVVLFNRSGAVVDTARWETADETAVAFRVGARQGYAPTLLISPFKAEGVNGRAIVEWSVPAGSTEGSMKVVRLDREGDSIYQVTIRYEPIPVPASVLDSLIAPRLPIAQGFGVTEREMESALRNAIQLPEFRPPVRLVHVGNDGTVWLQLNTPDTDSLSRWVVVGADGSARGAVRLPSRMRIYHSALPTVWAVDLDEVDVPWLVRLKVN